MNVNELEFVERPTGRALRRESFASRLRETLTNGQAVRVPVNGHPVDVCQKRVCSAAANIGKIMHAHARARKSDDCSAVLVWLEPKV